MDMQGMSYFAAPGDNGAFISTNPLYPILMASANPPPPFAHDPVCEPLADPGGTQCFDTVNLMTIVGGTQSASKTGTYTGCVTEAVWKTIPAPGRKPSRATAKTSPTLGWALAASARMFRCLRFSRPLSSKTKQRIDDEPEHPGRLGDGRRHLDNQQQWHPAHAPGEPAPRRSSGPALPPPSFTSSERTRRPRSGLKVCSNNYLYTLGQGPHYTSDFFGCHERDESTRTPADPTPLAGGAGLRPCDRLGKSAPLAPERSRVHPRRPLPPNSYDNATFIVETGRR